MKKVLVLLLVLMLTVTACAAPQVGKEDIQQLESKVDSLSAELKAIAASFSNGSTPQEGENDEVQPVVKLYQDACGGCHGPQRTGATGPALIPQRIGGLGEDFLAQVIRDGRPGTAMPPWKAVLSEQQVSDLIHYMQSPVEENTLAWNISDIRATKQIVVPANNLPEKPIWGGDVKDIMVVVERDISNLMFIDGSNHQVLKHVEAGYAIHAPSFNRKEAGDRWLWAISRNGWLTKIDLYSLQVVAKIRVGLDSRGTAISTDGKYVIAGNYIPNSAVIIDAETMEPLKVIDTFGVNSDGQAVKSRVAGLVPTPYQPYFELVLKEAGQVWVVDYSKPDFPIVGVIDGVGRILHETFLTEDGRYMQVASQEDGVIVIIDLEKLEIVKKIPAGNKPHPGPGAVWHMGDRAVAATPAIGEGLVTVWDTETWDVVGTVKTSGPGLFIRSNPTSKYVWVDVAFGDSWNDIYVFDKDTLEVVKVLSDGKRTIKPEFTYDGKFVYISAWEGGEILVYDSVTLELVKHIEAKTPTGIFNAGIRAESPEG